MHTLGNAKEDESPIGILLDVVLQMKAQLRAKSATPVKATTSVSCELTRRLKDSTLKLDHLKGDTKMLLNSRLQTSLTNESSFLKQNTSAI